MSEQPPPAQPGDESQAPRIGVDEWVASHEARRQLGRLQRELQRVPRPGFYAAFGIEIVVKVLSAGLAQLIDFAASFLKKHLQEVIISAIVTAACIVAANSAVGSLSSTYSGTTVGVIQAAANEMSNTAAGLISTVLLGIVDVAFSLYLLIKARALSLPLMKILGEGIGLALAFIGLAISVYSTMVATGSDQVALDLAALVVSLVGFQMALFSSGDAFSWVAKAADLLASISLAVDLVTAAGRNYNSSLLHNLAPTRVKRKYYFVLLFKKKTTPTRDTNEHTRCIRATRKRTQASIPCWAATATSA